MQDTACYQLTSYTVIQLIGAQALPLLQRITTANVQDLSTQPHVFTALCRPNGKTIASGWCWMAEPHVYWLIPHHMATPLIQAIHPYAQLSRVRCLPLKAHIYGMHRAQIPDQVLHTIHIGHKRTIIVQEQPLPNTQSESLWQYQDHQEGLALINATASNQFNPVQLHYGAWQALATNKGCYIGQEVINRLITQGSARHKLVHAHTSCTQVQACDLIMAQDRAIGKVISVAQTSSDTSILASIHHTQTDTKHWVINQHPLHDIHIHSFST